MVLKRLPDSNPGRPAAFLTSAEAVEPQTSSAKTGAGVRVVMPMKAVRIRAMILIDLSDFMSGNLL